MEKEKEEKDPRRRMSGYELKKGGLRSARTTGDVDRVGKQSYCITLLFHHIHVFIILYLILHHRVIFFYHFGVMFLSEFSDAPSLLFWVWLLCSL